MTEENKEGQAQPQSVGQIKKEVDQEPPVHTTVHDIINEAPKKVFTRDDIKRSVEVKIHFPKIYPDYEPFVFDFRLKLSREAEEVRQQYIALSPTEATEKISEQALNEVCDLLTKLPKGFGDLQDTGQGPGLSFRSYYETAGTEIREFLKMVVEGADSAYWNAISPREFRS